MVNKPVVKGPKPKGVRVRKAALGVPRGAVPLVVPHEQKGPDMVQVRARAHAGVKEAGAYYNEDTLQSANYDDIEEKQLLSCLHFYEVASKGNDYMSLKMLGSKGDPKFVNVSKATINEEFYALTKPLKTVKTNYTFLVTLLLSAKDLVKVWFYKQVDPKEAAEKLVGFQDDGKEATRIAKVQEVLRGPLRVLEGYIKTTAKEDKGRSRAIDLRIQGPNQERQINHQTLQAVQYRNVLYYAGKLEEIMA